MKINVNTTIFKIFLSFFIMSTSFLYAKEASLVVIGGNSAKYSSVIDDASVKASKITKTSKVNTVPPPPVSLVHLPLTSVLPPSVGIKSSVEVLPQKKASSNLDNVKKTLSEVKTSSDSFVASFQSSMDTSEIGQFFQTKSDMLNDYANKLDAMGSNLPKGLETVSQIIYTARSNMNSAGARAEARLASATSDAQRRAISRDALNESRSALSNASSEIRKAISLVRVNNPEAASVQREIVITIASAIDETVINLLRVSGVKFTQSTPAKSTTPAKVQVTEKVSVPLVTLLHKPGLSKEAIAHMEGKGLMSDSLQEAKTPSNIFEELGIKPVSREGDFEKYLIPKGYWSPGGISNQLYKCKQRQYCSGGTVMIDTISGVFMDEKTYKEVLNDRSLLIKLRGKFFLTTEDKVYIMNSLKLELKNANESDKPALLDRLKKVSQEIFSQTAVTPETMALMNEVSRNMELEQRRARNAQILANRNTMQINNQITTQQAEATQNRLQNTQLPVETPLPVGD